MVQLLLFYKYRSQPTLLGRAPRRTIPRWHHTPTVKTRLSINRVDVNIACLWLRGEEKRVGIRSDWRYMFLQEGWRFLLYLIPMRQLIFEMCWTLPHCSSSLGGLHGKSFSFRHFHVSLLSRSHRQYSVRILISVSMWKPWNRWGHPLTSSLNMPYKFTISSSNSTNLNK